MNELPNKPGRHSIARHVTLQIPPLGRPWFQIHVNFQLDGVQHERVRKVYVNVLRDFAMQVNEAKAMAAQLYAEVQDDADAFAKIKQLRANQIFMIEQMDLHARKLSDREKRTEAVRKVARNDVNGVIDKYGPALDLRKPFFIQQWI